ncbi:MAG TPA: MFS transporter [Acidimicrobiia bacterium]|nr:MFS transporter [Acidimicrobiia bacterium]
MSTSDPAPFVPGQEASGHLPPSPRRVFGSSAYFRLWMAQVVSSLGDWIGLVAVVALAARVSHGNEAAVGLVMAARMVPGFFLAPVGGVLVDRWDRGRTMVACDIGRAAIVATLPLVDTLVGLFLASFLLEILTLLWSPAKDASVPNLVPPDKLAAANSLSMAAAYGTFPVGSAIFASLAGLASWLGRFDPLEAFRIDQESLALWVDAATFLGSALLIMSLHLHLPRSRGDGQRIDWGQTWRELVEGLRFIRRSETVRSVMLGMGVGLVGCGSAVPLGPIYAREVLGSGSAGFGLLMTGLGTGAALGVLALSVAARRLPADLVFVTALFGAGIGLVLTTSTSSLTAAVVLAGVFGMFAGVCYVSGFTVIQERVADALRGRMFATLYTIIRFCLLLSLAVAPWLAGLLDSLSGALTTDRVIDLWIRIRVPGVRLTFWLGGLMTVAAGVVVSRDILRARGRASHPTNDH